MEVIWLNWEEGWRGREAKMDRGGGGERDLREEVRLERGGHDGGNKGGSNFKWLVVKVSHFG